MNWTDERVEKLKKLWAEGLSASQIAAQLGGVSPQAVVGKVHRLSLPGRAKAAGYAYEKRAPQPAPRTPANSRSSARANSPNAARHVTRGNLALAVAWADPELEHEEALRIAQIVTLAESVFGAPDKAHAWLRKPNRALNGIVPMIS
jgi:GcrA cell cycle regulator